jgi:hypothetical protein
MIHLIYRQVLVLNDLLGGRSMSVRHLLWAVTRVAVRMSMAVCRSVAVCCSVAVRLDVTVGLIEGVPVRCRLWPAPPLAASQQAHLHSHPWTEADCYAVLPTTQLPALLNHAADARRAGVAAFPIPLPARQCLRGIGLGIRQGHLLGDGLDDKRAASVDEPVVLRCNGSAWIVGSLHQASKDGWNRCSGQFGHSGSKNGLETSINNLSLGNIQEDSPSILYR